MKNILVIGMVDSIHTFHWIERIADGALKIDLLPSRRYRKVHPELRKLVESKTNLRILNEFPINWFSPYWDVLGNLVLRIFGKDRSEILKRVIKSSKYDFIHALEIQHAGYMMLEVVEEIQSSCQSIVTNWGSDIYYFSQFPSHERKIRNVRETTTWQESSGFEVSSWK